MKTRKRKTKKIIKQKEVELLLSVKEDTFFVAKQLDKLGLYITHVLDNTKTIIGYCTHTSKSAILANKNILTVEKTICQDN